jgi:hypothetical protein
MGANVFSQQVRACLAKLASADGTVRFDANETAFTERLTTQVRAKLFEVVYAELKAQQLVPIASDIAAELGPYVYNVLDTVGEAKVIASGSDDLPRVDVSLSERSGVIRAVGASYGWDVFELKKAARLAAAGAGFSLSEVRARQARQAIARQVDKLLSNGQTDSQSGLQMEGLLNNTDVTNLGIAAGTLWVLGTTSAPAMIGELSAVVQTIVTATNETWIPDTIVLPTGPYQVISQTPYSVNSDKTALRWFLDNNPYIKNVTSWYRGTGAGASSKHRGIVYKRAPEALEGIVPLAFEQQPPEVRGLEMLIACYAMAGGVKWYHPESARYIDFSLT